MDKSQDRKRRYIQNDRQHDLNLCYINLFVYNHASIFVTREMEQPLAAQKSFVEKRIVTFEVPGDTGCNPHPPMLPCLNTMLRRKCIKKKSKRYPTHPRKSHAMQVQITRFFALKYACEELTQGHPGSYRTPMEKEGDQGELESGLVKLFGKIHNAVGLLKNVTL